MDRTMQKHDKMQEEEIYALLDKALENNRLCVSEELIQKTLQRAAEEGAPEAAAVKSRKKKYPVLKYACTAAAAALLIFVGGRAFAGKGFSPENLRQEGTSDPSLQDNEMHAPGVAASESSVRNRPAADGTGDLPEDSFPVEPENADRMTTSEEYTKAADLAEVIGRKDTPVRGETVTMSDALPELLSESESSRRTAEAECWELVQRREAWEEEVIQGLKAGEPVRETLPKEGAYVYTLICQDGSERVIGFEEPLDMVVRIKNEQEWIWCLFGEGVHFYRD